MSKKLKTTGLGGETLDPKFAAILNFVKNSVVLCVKITSVLIAGYMAICTLVLTYLLSFPIQY